MIETIQMQHYLVWDQLQQPSYAGFCPICSNPSLTNTDFNAGFGNVFKLATCTVCYSHSRHRLLYLYLKGIFEGLKTNVNFLHFAPEHSLETLIRSYPNVNYLSADLYNDAAMQKEDITNLSIEDNTFDCILNVHVMEHIEDDQKAYSEMFRVLKPGGVAFIDVPMGDLKRGLKTYEDFTITDPALRSRHFGQYDHVRIYGRDIARRMAKCGFVVQPMFFYDDLSLEDKIKFGLYRQFVFLCFKPTNNLSFSVLHDSIFKSLPNKEVLNIAGEKNGYLVDVLGATSVSTDKEALFEIQYLITTGKKLFIGLCQEEYGENFSYTEYLDIEPENNCAQFKFQPEKELFDDKNQLHMLVRIINESYDQYEIVDEIIVDLKLADTL